MGSVWAPYGLRMGSVWAPYGLRMGSVWAGVVGWGARLGSRPTDVLTRSRSWPAPCTACWLRYSAYAQVGHTTGQQRRGGAVPLPPLAETGLENIFPHRDKGREHHAHAVNHPPQHRRGAGDVYPGVRR